jgi:DNA modification methylase
MLIQADSRTLPLADGCVSCVVTSPPYWGLRDYGDPQQIGLESTPDAYVAQLVAVFREVRRVLADDGTVWLNLGDSYAGSNASQGGDGSTATYTDGRRHVAGAMARQVHRTSQQTTMKVGDGLKSKDLVGIPWRVAFALQADGWYLRSDIIWSKPNPMPESVTDRPTKAHEYIFLLAKAARYYYDAAAIADAATFGAHHARYNSKWAPTKYHNKNAAHADVCGSNEGLRGGIANPLERNKRSVWHVATQPYPDAHFATFPEALIEPCILAGCPVGGRVLDPFIGSGTTGAVAERLGRRWVGVDLTYQHLARARTAQRGLMWA